MKTHKQQLLDSLRNHIGAVQTKIAQGLQEATATASKSIRDIAKMKPENQPVEMQLRSIAIQRVEELNHLRKTPYFVKCEVIDGETKQSKTFYFAKHQFSDESIYSWVAPIASIRFETPGTVSYTVPSGERKQLLLTAREQYMIVDGKVLFFAREEGTSPRELVYQEHFTQRKQGFVLPEIVAQMEKAQDQVIRAHHAGPLVISGPAGSGKTTLALHRVAYLTQAPDTATLYPTDKIIVFVQDTGTKEYFSQLLPELGIHNVTITTFSSWALSILGLTDYTYITRYGNTDEERDIYEYQKIKALREQTLPQYTKSNPLTVLTTMYGTLPQFIQQKKEKKLDRFDITILISAYLATYTKIETTETNSVIVNNVLKKRVTKNLIQYSLMVIDEFQNYLPEQLTVLKSCVRNETKSIIYVGDTAQQVYLGTIKQWGEIQETITPERSIKLDKVYRNTKNILTYIKHLGYAITIPEGIKEGPPVIERYTESFEEEIEHIKNYISQYADGSIGILSKNETYLYPFKHAFEHAPNIHILTMNESQGVEFDLVCIVGIRADTFTVTHHTDVAPQHIIERTAMQKDLLYVALTRAITELHVLGNKKLAEVIL